MADGTHIEWTDATWNVVTGCQIVSPGCTNCYAMTLAGTRLKHHPSRAGLTQMTNAGPVWTGAVRFNAEWLEQPLRWRKPRDVFVAAHGDLFHPAVSDETIDQVFLVMERAHWHRFQLLTKRPERMRQHLASSPLGRQPGSRWPLLNVWCGASVEDQPRANLRREPMRNVAALGWRTWVSYEPALRSVDWAGWEFIAWLVSGGESVAGHAYRARPSRALYHRMARDWCAGNGVAYFFKQWGDWIDADHWLDIVERGPGTIERCGRPWKPSRPLNYSDAEVVADVAGKRPFDHFTDGSTMIWVGKHAAGAMLDGREWRDMPRVA